MPEEIVLSLTEEGYFEQMFGESNWSDDPDDEEWIHTGWQVRNYDGKQLYRHETQRACHEWLISHGYRPCADGSHYELEDHLIPLDAAEQAEVDALDNHPF